MTQKLRLPSIAFYKKTKRVGYMFKSNQLIFPIVIDVFIMLSFVL